MTGRVGVGIALAFGAGLGLGCSFNRPAAAPPAACQTDGDCDAQQGCTGGTCVVRGFDQAMPWSVEIVPASDSIAAPTELPSVSIGDTDLVLTAAAKATVTGHLAPGSALAGDSHVVATLASMIAGRQDLQFEIDWAAPVTDGGTSKFALVVPANVVGGIATLNILPLPPRDQAQPPVTVDVTLAPDFDVPINNQFWFVTGRLVSALQQPIGGFTARAFHASRLVSNAFPVASNGFFRLAILPEALGDAPADLITVDLSPGDTTPSPSFTTLAKPIQSDLTNLGDLVMPAFGAPTSFRFVVTDPANQPVSDATVTVQTAISDETTMTPTGVANYSRSGRTDVDGHVDLALLPGTAAEARIYDISVFPPASSPFGIRCQPNFQITVPGYGDHPIAATLNLPARIELWGTILSADGKPVGGVSIAATRTAADPSEVCATTSTGLPAGGISDQDGNYRLLLDPGTYRIDYDPPPGAPVPRLTDPNIVVPAGGVAGERISVQHIVQLHPGALVRGSAVGPDGNGVASAGVRFFQVLCSGASTCLGPKRVEPLLGAEAHTDDNGQFSAVLPIRN